MEGRRTQKYSEVVSAAPRPAGQLFLMFMETLTPWVTHSQIQSVADLIIAGVRVREGEKG